MKSWRSCLRVLVVFAACGLGLAFGQQNRRPGTVIVPPTSVEHPENVGKRAHTNFLIFVPAARSGQKPSPNASGGPSGETPSSLACVYQTGPAPAPGCPITNTNYDNPDGGSKVIAIVDAYDYPTAAADFANFSKQFGLPYGNSCGPDHNAACLSVQYAAGSKPAADCGWAQEAAIDIEWAHAMAPNAQIILVEAASNSYSDLLPAVDVASGLVANAGGGQVSMSWGGGEFRTQSTYESYFTTNGVTYFASSGDSGGKVIWPSTSPNVVSAGGTSINRDSSGDFTGETTWNGSGGGPSRYSPVPDYQNSIYSLAQLLGQRRGTPDLSFDADPYTGVSIYDSTSCQGYVGWQVFGGTSVSAPSLAGIANLSGAFDGGWDGGTNDASVQNHLYQSYDTASSGGTQCGYTSPTNSLYDVTTGSAGRYSATGCWDFTTGIGTLRGLTGLTGSTSPSFSLSASPTSLSLTADNTSGTSTITVSPSGGFNSTVNLTASVSPNNSGVTASLSKASVSLENGSYETSTLTVSATSTASGEFTVTITGTGSGQTSSATVTVTVTQGASGGDFSISAWPSSQATSPGGSTTYTVSVGSLENFSGSVSLSVSGLPKFESARFSPNPVTISSDNSASSALIIKTNRNVARNTYELTVTGISGSLSHSTDITLTVQ